ncbi:hypothetical protein QGN23_11385 [Chryseobacterium gotjawalense]|uniref:Uncharacterized protein n=1 Tax=Chryseobacterium gotjawalense TaxID=3042315 RepID=A0ABY8RC09_9FLAO|nr:hypothetical protein [Chryseobacterium sp. wdc7]WHF51029.1 hypothetical protein QGN23_11385 [Chryseobacterium sp. wdc7]
MTDNLEDKNVDYSTIHPPENVPEEKTLPNNTEKSESTHPKETIEVHHHPKVEKKKVKEYLMEGLFIFIAVSLGFIADNIREHFSNKEIEKRNMELIADNLRGDIENIKKNIRYNEEKVKILDTLISYKGIKNVDSLYSQRFSYLVTKSIYNPTFFSNTAAIDQMKFSGSLRLVKNKEILSGIYKYEGMNEHIATIREGINDDDDRLVENASTFLDMQNLAKSRGIHFLETNQIISNKQLLNNQQNIFKFFNQAIMRKSILEIIWLPQMRKQQKNAEELVKLLEQEYDINQK